MFSSPNLFGICCRMWPSVSALLCLPCDGVYGDHFTLCLPSSVWGKRVTFVPVFHKAYPLHPLLLVLLSSRLKMVLSRSITDILCFIQPSSPSLIAISKILYRLFSRLSFAETNLNWSVNAFVSFPCQRVFT